MKIKRKTQHAEIPKIETESPHCQTCTWSDFHTGYYCQKCRDVILKQKHKIVKNVPGGDKNFSKKLPYAKKQIRELVFSMNNTKYNKIEEISSILKNWEVKRI